MHIAILIAVHKRIVVLHWKFRSTETQHTCYIHRIPFYVTHGEMKKNMYGQILFPDLGSLFYIDTDYRVNLRILYFLYQLSNISHKYIMNHLIALTRHILRYFLDFQVCIMMYINSNVSISMYVHCAWFPRGKYLNDIWSNRTLAHVSPARVRGRNNLLHILFWRVAKWTLKVTFIAV